MEKIFLELKEIKERMGEHDAQLNQIYDALENLLDEKSFSKKMARPGKNWL